MRILLATGCLALCACPWTSLHADATRSESPAGAMKAVSELLQEARARVDSKPWGALEPADAVIVRDVETLEGQDTGRVMNSVRAIARVPRLAKPLAHLYCSVLLEGTIPRARKMGMGIRVAQITGSPYTVAHLERLLRSTDGGPQILSKLQKAGAGRSGDAESAETIALDYAEWLTRDIGGVTDERFRKVRPFYTDAQIVELTITVAFFNFYTRFVEALHLPVEPWVFNSEPALPGVGPPPSSARVSLISDPIIGWAKSVRPNPYNSQRAMYLVPAMAEAWNGVLGGIQRDSSVGSEILREVSFAVSTANGCRYCSMHQVRFLKEIGVSPAKLLAMEKDDSALSPKELTAVQFARKVTREPTAVTGGDWEKLKTQFGEQGALEVLGYACGFNFMNRFTDNLGLSPEDEAVKAYREVYNSDWKGKKR